MGALRVVALLLILVGGIGLAAGNFTFTKESHDAKIGPLSFSVKEKETVYIPGWIAAAAIGSGVLMLLVRRKEA
jgi:hypothetical protein